MTSHRKSVQPEALATLGEASRAGGRKPDDIGLSATPDTTPVPTRPDLKDEAATKVLRRGVMGSDEGADAAAKALPDRTADGPKSAG
ncbi:hypothetical protein [Phreatobacter sp.]|uniref:hypothetical protein n=1 Tax=Phreatobacter sp. TaxID=1966341 RepID=UPI003F70A243